MVQRTRIGVALFLSAAALGCGSETTATPELTVHDPFAVAESPDASTPSVEAPPSDQTGDVVSPIDDDESDSEADSYEDSQSDAGIELGDDTRTPEPESDEPEETDPVPSEPATFTRVYGILHGWCITCHGGGRTLDLSSRDTAYAQLVNMSAAYSACASEGTLRVVPGDAANSLLMQKLEGTQECGSPMPPSGESLIQQDGSLMAEIRSWIDAGALDN